MQETRIYRLLDNSSPSNHQRKTWKTRTSPSGTLEVSVLVFWQHRLFCDMINQYKWDTAELFLTIQPEEVSPAIAVYAASSSKLWELAAFTLGVYTWQMITAEQYEWWWNGAFDQLNFPRKKADGELIAFKGRKRSHLCDYTNSFKRLVNDSESGLDSDQNIVRIL